MKKLFLSVAMLSMSLGAAMPDGRKPDCCKTKEACCDAKCCAADDHCCKAEVRKACTKQCRVDGIPAPHQN